MGNSAPYGHRGDLTTITEAILVHGGEARAARDAFDLLAVDDKAAVVKFLKSLQVLPAGSPPVVIGDCGGAACAGDAAGAQGLWRGAALR